MTGLHLERTPDGRRFVVDHIVPADVETVWAVLTDTQQWPAWGPSVSAVRSPDRYVRSGATGKVQIFGGPWIPFEITTCTDTRWTWRVAGVPATGHRVESVEEGARVGFEIPLLALWYVPVCQRALTRITAISTAGTAGRQ